MKKKPQYKANGTIFEGKKWYYVMNNDGSGHIEWLTNAEICKKHSRISI